MNLLQLLAVLLPMGYLSAAILFLRARSERRENAARWTLRGVLALHFVYLLARGERIGEFPIVDLWTVFSAVAFSTALMWSIVARGEHHSGSGGIVLACTTLLQVVSSGLSDLEPAVRAKPLETMPIVHIAMSVVSISALVLSGIHGALYLTLFRQMRNRTFGILFERLPDLDLLARMTRRSALYGFLGLTVGLNLGIGLAHALNQPGFNYRHPEVLVSLLLWVHFGVVAFSRRIPGFGARRASFAAAGGLAVLLLSLLLVLLPGRFHVGA